MYRVQPLHATEPVALAIVEAALALAEGGRCQGCRDHWLRVELPGRESVLLKVRPRGVEAIHTRARHFIELGRGYLVAGSPAWERACCLIEAAAELRDTGSD